MVGRLLEALPTQAFDGYCEPFLGGGAMFRHLAGLGRLNDLESILGDFSAATTLAWRDVKQLPDAVTVALQAYKHEYDSGTDGSRESMYLRERKLWNTGKISGSRHIFLRNTSFNGLWRVNRKDEMNAPWGKYAKFNAPDIRPLHNALINASVVSSPWSITLNFAKPGWLVYLDPPYIDEFTGYTSSGFNEDDQILLLRWCAEAQERGIHVVYSNRYGSKTLELLAEYWKDAVIHRAVRSQTVAAKNLGRGDVEELIATTTP